MKRRQHFFGQCGNSRFLEITTMSFICELYGTRIEYKMLASYVLRLLTYLLENWIKILCRHFFLNHVLAH